MDKISVGQFYETRGAWEDALYMLTEADEKKVCLIVIGGMDNGNRWISPIRVSNVRNITPKEWKEITGCHTFTRITDKHIIEITEL